MSLEKNLLHNVREIKERIAHAALHAGRRGEEITCVAVTKGRSLEEMREIYRLGIRDFGESRVAEALKKMEQIPSDVRWHFIGKLQKNKVGKVIGRFALIHSVDDLELAEKISKLSLQRGVKSAILLEVNTSGEVSKSGLTSEEWTRNFPTICALEGIEIRGLMTMAPLSEDEVKIRHCFAQLRILQEILNKQGGNLKVLSMGMSSDFHLAILEGATMVRVGTLYFV